MSAARAPAGLLVTLLLLAVPPPAAVPALVPNDPLFDASPDPRSTAEQWNLTSDGRGISADLAWDTTLGEGQVIAVIDTGADLAHEDLSDQLWTSPGETGSGRESNGLDDDGNGYVDDWRGWDFYEDDNDPTDAAGTGHGTGTAGIATAEQGNGLGVSGVAPGARVMVLRAGDTFVMRPDRVARAIRYAADNGADVVSMSVGTLANTRFLRRAAAQAEAKEVVLVAAMANEFSTHANIPTVYDQVVGVGAVVPDTTGTGTETAADFTVKASYSNFGPLVDLVAPSHVLTTRLGGGYGKIGGTSAATPHAAGVAALVRAAGEQRGLDLSAGEVISILRRSAEDLTGGPYRYGDGWDRYSGWGRLDAAAAVAMAAPGRVPPVADIDRPNWFALRRGGVVVRGALSARSMPYRWVLAVGRGAQPRQFERIAVGTRSAPFAGRLGRVAAGGRRDGLYTLRLRVIDAKGAVGEDRQVFTLKRDPALLPGFPLRLGASGESAPQPADLDGDGRREIVLADADGRVHALRGDGAELPGWPVLMDGIAWPGGEFRAGFIATPAVADLDEDDDLEVVVGGLDGKVYAWDHRGNSLPGWPVPTRVPPGPDPANQAWESMIISSPAVADLDGSPGLEIVEGAGDGRVYAWHADGSPVTGWPALIDDPAVPGIQTNKLVSSPAVADIDADGSMEIVIGSGEHYPEGGRVWVLEADGGTRPGWPTVLPEVVSASVPLVGQGVPQSPVLADADGDGTLEIAISGFTGQFHLYRPDGSEFPAGGPAHFATAPFGPGSDSSEVDQRATAANLSWGDLDRDGVADLVSGATGFGFLLASLTPGIRHEFDHLVAAWRSDTGDYLPAFPRVIEDWMFLTTPVLADVDGDRRPEVVMGSGEGRLHAFRSDGSEPSGWPKRIGQWIQTSAAAADLVGGRRTEIVALTRGGWLFAYATDGRPAGLDWPSARSDPTNTGVFTP